MIRIAAMLAKITKVTDGFADQLSTNAYVYIEEGILNITDQIMLAVDEDDDPDNFGSERNDGGDSRFLRKAGNGREAGRRVLKRTSRSRCHHQDKFSRSESSRVSCTPCYVLPVCCPACSRA
jgi:hypothetical protein